MLILRKAINRNKAKAKLTKPHISSFDSLRAIIPNARLGLITRTTAISHALSCHRLAPFLLLRCEIKARNMSHYSLEQALDEFKKNLPETFLPFDLPQIADLCRQGILTPFFAYNGYGIEVLESYDGNKPFIYKNELDPEPDTSKFPDPRTTSLYDDHFTHDRLTSLLDKSIDNLEIYNAITYRSYGSEYEVVLVAKPLNVNKYLNDENYSVYSDNDGYTVTRESLLFPSEQVQNYIASKQTAKQNTPEQQEEIAKLKKEIAEFKERLNQKADNTVSSLLKAIYDENHEHHAPDLSHAIKLWNDLYMNGLIGTDSHSNKASLWIGNNTGYADDAKSSTDRIKEISSPSKNWSPHRKKEIKK